MKVLLITQDYPPRPGGMARYYADWGRGLGEDAWVAAGGWEGHPPTRQGSETLIELPFDASVSHRPWNLWRTRRALRRMTVEARPRVLVAGNIRPFGPVARGICARSGLPLVLAYHGNDLLRTARRWRAHPVKGRRWREVTEAAALHVVNSAFTAGLAERLGLPAGRVAVVPPEVDTGRFRPAAGQEERAALRHGFGWQDGEVITLFVGRLVERKGLGDLFAALAALPAPARLVVAGPGPTGPWSARADEAGVSDRVRFLGAVSDEVLPQLYRAADLFAGPSRDRSEQDDVEGFGIVYLEAAASGLAVLATRTGGIPEAVEEGAGGLLVEPGDVDALAAAWNRLVADAALRAQLGRGGLAGRARVHGPGSSATRLRSVLERAL